MKFSCTKRDLSRLSFLLKTLSEENRLRIICFLKEKEYCVCEIVKALGLPPNLLSHHLKALKEIGLLECRREGKFQFYRLNKRTLDALLDNFLKVMKRRQIKCCGN